MVRVVTGQLTLHAETQGQCVSEVINTQNDSEVINGTCSLYTFFGLEMCKQGKQALINKMIYEG